MKKLRFSIFLTTLLGGVASQVTTSGGNTPGPPNNYTSTKTGEGAVKYARYNSGPTMAQRSEAISVSDLRSEPTSFSNSQSLPMQTIRFYSNPGDVIRYTSAPGSSNGGGQQQSVDPPFSFSSQAASAAETQSSRTLQPPFISYAQQDAQRNNYFAGQGDNSMASGNAQQLNGSNLPPFQSAQSASRTIQYLKNPNLISTEQTSRSSGRAPSEYELINQLKTGDVESTVSNPDVRNSSVGELSGYSQRHAFSPDSRPSKLQASHYPDATQEPPNPSDSSNPATSTSLSSIPTVNGRSIINGRQLTQNKSTDDSSQQKSHNVNDITTDVNDALPTMDNRGITGERQWHDSPEAEEQKSSKHYPIISLTGEQSSSNSSEAGSTISQSSADTSNSTSPNKLDTANSTQPPADDTSAPNSPISKDNEQIPQQLVLNRTSELSPNISSSGNNPRGQVGTIFPKVNEGARAISFSQTPNIDGSILPKGAFKAVDDPSQLTFIPTTDPYTSNNFPFRPMGDMSSLNPTDIHGNMNPRLPNRLPQHSYSTHDTFHDGPEQSPLKNLPNNFNGGPNPFSSSRNFYPDGQTPPPFIKMDPQPDSYVSIIPDGTNSRFPRVQLLGESFSPGTFEFDGTIALWSSSIPILFGDKPIHIVSTNGRTQSSEPSFQNVSPNFPGFFISSRNYDSLRSSLFPTNTVGQPGDNIDTFSSIAGRQPPTQNTPIATTSGQSGIKMPAYPNNFDPTTPNTPGSMFLFSTNQNPTNNMTGSDRLYLFPISIRFNIPSGVRFAGKIKYPTPESGFMRPSSLSFNPTSILSQPGTHQDPSLGATLSPIFRLASSIPLSAMRSTTKPFGATGTLDIINYFIPDNPSDSVTPDPLPSGRSVLTGFRNVPERPMMGFPNKPFNPTSIDPPNTNYGNQYYGNPNDGYPYFDNPENPSYSSTPLGKFNFPGFLTIPGRPRPGSTNKPFDTIGIPGITSDGIPNNGEPNDRNPNNGNPNYDLPNQENSKYDNSKDPSIPQSPGSFPLHSPTMPAPSIIPVRKITGSKIKPIEVTGTTDIAHDDNPNYVNPDYEKGNPNYGYPKLDNSVNPSGFWTLDDSFPQPDPNMPASRKIPGRQITGSPTKLFNATRIPDITNYSNPNYGNPNYGNLVYRNPNYVNPNYRNPNYENPNDGNPNYGGNPIFGNPNYGNPTDSNPSYGDRNYRNPNYRYPNYGNPNGNSNYDFPNKGNPNYGNQENPSIPGTLDSVPLRDPTTSGFNNIPERPLTASRTPDITNYSDPIYVNPNYGNPTDGSPNNRNPNNGNPNYGNPNYGSPNSGNPNYGSPANGNPNYGSPTNGNPDYGSPTNGNPNNRNSRYGNRNYGTPNYVNPSYGNTNDGNTNYRNPENVSNSGKLDSSPLRNPTMPGSPKIPERPITATGTPDMPNDSNPNYLNHYGNPNNGNQNYGHPSFGTPTSGNPNNINTNYGSPTEANPNYENPETPYISGTFDSFSMHDLTFPGSRKIPERPITASRTPDMTNDSNPNYGTPNNRNPNYGHSDTRNPKYDIPENPSISGVLDSFPLRSPTTPGAREIPERPISASGTPDMPNDSNLNYVNPNYGIQNNRIPNYGNPNNKNPKYYNPHNPSISGTLDGFPIEDLTLSGSPKIPERPISATGTQDMPNYNNPNYVNPNYGTPNKRNPNYGYPNNRNPNYDNPENPFISEALDIFPLPNPTTPGARQIPERPISPRGTPDMPNDSNPNYVNPYYENQNNRIPNYGNPNNKNPKYYNPQNPSISVTSDGFQLGDPTLSGTRKIPERPISASGTPDMPNDSNPNYVNPNYGNQNNRIPNYGNPNNKNPKYYNLEHLSISGTLDGFPLGDPTLHGSHKIPERPIPATGTPDMPNGSNQSYVNPNYGTLNYGTPNNKDPKYDNPENPSISGTLDSFPLHDPTMSGSRKVPEWIISATGKPDMTNDDNPNYVNPNNVTQNNINTSYGHLNNRNPKYGIPDNPTFSGALDKFPLHNPTLPGVREIPERPISASGTPDMPNDSNPNYVNPNYGNPNNRNPNYGNPTNKNPKYDNPENLSLSGTSDRFPLHDPTMSGYHKIPERPISATGKPDMTNDNYPNYVNTNYGTPNDNNPKYDNPENPSIYGTLDSFPLRNPTMPDAPEIPGRPISPSGTPDIPNDSNPNYVNPYYENQNNRIPNYGNPNNKNPKYYNPQNPSISGTLDGFQLGDPTLPGSRKTPERPISATGTPDMPNDNNPNYVNPNYGTPNNRNPNYGVPNNEIPEYDVPENPSISGELDKFPSPNPTTIGARDIPERPISASGTPDLPNYSNSNYVNPNYGNQNNRIPNYGNPNNKNPKYYNLEHLLISGTLDGFPLGDPTLHGSHKIPERPISATGTPDMPNDSNQNYVNPNYGTPNYGIPNNKDPKYDNPENPSISGTLDSIPLHDHTVSGSRKIPEWTISVTGKPDMTNDDNPNYVNPNNVTQNYRNTSYGHLNNRNPKYDIPENPTFSGALDKFPLRNPTLPDAREIPERPISASGTPDMPNDSNPNYVNPNYGNPNNRNPNYGNPTNKNPKYDNPENLSLSGTSDRFPLHDPTMSGYRKIPERPISATGKPDMTNDNNPNYVNTNYGTPNDRNPKYDNPENPSIYGTLDSFPLRNPTTPDSREIPGRPISPSGTPYIPNDSNPNYVNPYYENPNNGNPNNKNPKYYNPQNPYISGTLDGFQLGDPTLPGSRNTPERPLSATETPDMTNDSNPSYVNLNYRNENNRNPNYGNPYNKTPKYDNPEIPSIFGTYVRFSLRDPTLPGSHEISEMPITASGTPDIANDSNPNYVNPNYGNPEYGNLNNKKPRYDNPENPSLSGRLDSFPLHDPATPGSSKIADRPISATGTPHMPNDINPNNVNPIYGTRNYGNPNNKNPKYYNSENPSITGTLDNFPFHDPTTSSSRNIPGRPVTATVTPDMPNDSNPNYVNPNDGNPNYVNPNDGNPNYGNPNVGNPNYGRQTNGNPKYGNPNYGNPNFRNPNYGNPNQLNSNYDKPENPSISGALDSFPVRDLTTPSSGIIPKRPKVGPPTKPFSTTGTSDITNNRDPNYGNPIYANQYYADPNYGHPNDDNPKYGHSNYGYPKYDDSENPSISETLYSFPNEDPPMSGSRKVSEWPITGSPTKLFDTTGTPDITIDSNPNHVNPSFGDPNADNPDIPSTSVSAESFPLHKSVFSAFQNFPDRPSMGSPAELFNAKGTLDIKYNYGNPKYGYPNNGSPEKPSDFGGPEINPLRKSIISGSLDLPVRPIIGSSTKPFDATGKLVITSYENPTYDYPENSSDSGTPENLPLQKFTFPGSRNFPKRPIMGSPTKPFDATGTPVTANNGNPNNGNPSNGNPNDSNPYYKYPNYDNIRNPPDSGTPDSFPLRNFPSSISRYHSVTIFPQQTIIGSPTNPFDATRTPDFTNNADNPKYGNSSYVNPNNSKTENSTQALPQIPMGKTTLPGFRKFLEKPVMWSATKLSDAPDFTNEATPDFSSHNPTSSKSAYTAEPRSRVSYNGISDPSRVNPILGVHQLIEMGGIQPEIQYIRKRYPLGYQFGMQPDPDITSNDNSNPSLLNSLPIEQPFSGSRMNVRANPTTNPETQHLPSYHNPSDYNKLPSSSTMEASQEPSLIGQPNGYELYSTTYPANKNTAHRFVTIPSGGSPDPTTGSSSFKPGTQDLNPSYLAPYPAQPDLGNPSSSDLSTLRSNEPMPSVQEGERVLFGGTYPLELDPTDPSKSTLSPSTSQSGQEEVTPPNMTSAESNLYNPSQRSSGPSSEPFHLKDRSLPLKHFTDTPTTDEQQSAIVDFNRDTKESTAGSSKPIDWPGQNSPGRPRGTAVVTVIPNYSKGSTDSETFLDQRPSNTYQPSNPTNNDTNRSIRYYPAYSQNTRSEQTPSDQSTLDKHNFSTTFVGEQPGQQNLTNTDQSQKYPTLRSDQLNLSNPTLHNAPEPSSKEQIDADSPNSATITYYRTGQRSGIPGPSPYYSTSILPGQTPGERSASDPRYGGRGYIINKLPGTSDTPADTLRISDTTTIQSSNTPGSIQYYAGNIQSNQTTGERSASDQDNVAPTNDNKTPSAHYITKQYTYSSPKYHTQPSSQLTDSSDPSSRLPSEPISKEQLLADSPDGAAITYYRTKPPSIRYYSPITISGLTSSERSATSQDNVDLADNDKTPSASYITKQYTVSNYPTQLSNQLTNSSGPSVEPSSKEQIDSNSPDSDIKPIRTGQRTTGSIRYYQPNILPDPAPEELLTTDRRGGQTYVMNKQPSASDTSSDTSRISGRTMIQTSTTGALSQGSTINEGIGSALVHIQNEAISSENLEGGKHDSGLTLDGQMMETRDSARLPGSPLTISSGVPYRIGTSSPVYGSATDSAAGKSISYDAVAQATNVGSYSGNISPSVKMIPATQTQSQVTGTRYMITNPASSITTQYSTGPILSSSGTSTVHHQYITQPITTQVRYSVVPAAYRQISGAQNGQVVTSTFQPLGEMKSMIPIMASLPKGMKAGVTRGKYSYTGPDGKTVTTNWYVDETGFHIEGDQNGKTRPEDTKTS